MHIIASFRLISTPPAQPRFRATIRLDDVVHDLAGVYLSPREAQEVANAMLISIRKNARETMRRVSVMHVKTRSGKAAPPLPINSKVQL